MTIQEKEIYKAVHENSLVFFRDFILRLTTEDKGEEDHLSKDLVILTVASLQISMELALKAEIIRRSGLENIVSEKIKSKNHDEFIELFKENKLKSIQFEQLKDFASKNEIFPSIDEDDYTVITEFQRYRNGIVVV